MPVPIISASGIQYGAIVSPEGRILVDMSGTTIFIGSVSANVDSIYVQSGANIVGSVYLIDTPPFNILRFNPNMVLQYSGTAITSIYKNTNAGSYVQNLTYDVSGNLTNISAWAAIA